MIPRRVRDMLAERSAGICEVCGLQRATNAHHRKNRSQGGTDTLANLLHVCGSGTTECHGEITVYPDIACEFGWSVRHHDEPAEQPVWYRGREWVRLDDDGGLNPTAYD